MRFAKRAPTALACLCALGAVATASNALAVDCQALQHPVYVAGSSASQPLMSALGAALYPGTTIVYQSQGSCPGVASQVANAPISGTAKYYPAYDDAGAPAPADCDLVPDGGAGAQ